MGVRGNLFWDWGGEGSWSDLKITNIAGSITIKEFGNLKDADDVITGGGG